MGDVGAVATLLNTLASWALDPNGYAKMSLENKLEKLHDALLVALEANAFDAVDRLNSELRRLRENAGNA